MTEREKHGTGSGGTDSGGSSRRISRVAALVAVALLACATVAGLVGTAAAAQPTEASASSFDQAVSDSGTITVNDVEALDSDGNPTSDAVVVVTAQRGDFNTGFDHKVVEINTNPGTLDGTTLTLDIDTSEAPGEHRVHIFPDSELNGGVLDGLSEGDVLEEATIDGEWSNFVEPELRSGDGITTPAAPLDIYYTADANAQDKTVSQDSLGSVTLSGSPLVSYENGVDTLSDDFTVVVSEQSLSPGDGKDDSSVLDTNDGNTGSVNSLTFDLSGDGLSGSPQLYVSVYARGELVRVGSDDIVSDSFTLTVEEPDLQVTSIDPQDDSVVEGKDDLDVDVTLENQGDADATDQTVTLEVDPDQNGNFAEEDTAQVSVNSGDTDSSVTLTYTTQEGDADAVDVRVTTEDDTDGITETASIEKAAPDTITNGDASPDPIDPGETSNVTAELLDGDGNPFEGGEVTFSHDGNGDLTVTQGTSDSNGEVEAEYTADIDDRAGTVTVTVESVDDSTVTENVDIGVNDATLSLSLDGTEPVDPATGGNANEVQLEAELTGDGPIEGEPISFNIDTGNGGLSNADGQTDANGEATVTYTVGENDWDTGVEVSAEIDGTSITDTAAFDVEEPDLVIGVTSAQNEIPPTGENDVTATVTYEPPFDDQEQENVGVTFGILTGAGSLVNPDSQTDTNGEATVTYDPAEADFGGTVEVFGAVGLVEGPEPEPSSITTQQELGLTQDSTTFDVQEPVEVNATADLGVTAPDGVGITFELRNPDIQNTQLSNTTSEGDGEVTVNFDQDGNGEVLPEGDYTVEVVSADGAYQTGVTDTVSVNAGETGEATLLLEGEDATLDVEAELGVTAPEDGFDVNVDIGVPGGTDVSETVTLQKGEGTLADSADSSEFGVDAIDHDEEYAVTVSANGYEDASATGYVEPGGAGTIDAGTLGANALDIEASSELGVPLSGGDSVDVTYTLEGPEGNEDNKTDEGVTDTSSVVFASVEALDAGEEYTVTADADGYEEEQETTPGAPGDGTEEIDEEPDLGALDAVPAEVDALAELEAEPGEDTTVTFRLRDESGVVDTQTDDVGPDETETDNVMLAADFSGDAGAGDTYEVEAEATDGNENYTADTETVGELNPGNEATADGLFLEADPATVNAQAELGAAPGEDTTVTFRLLNGTGGIVEEGTDEVSPGETETDNITLTADFSEEGIDSGQYTVGASVTGGDEKYTDNETGVGELHPGDTASADDLLLEVVEVNEANGIPQASFTFSPSEPTTGEKVNFFALTENPTGPGDPDGTIQSYEWDFDGDGTTDTTTSTQTVSHSYSSPGTYTVELTVTDDDGNTDSATRTVIVGVGNLPDQPPTASFTFSPENPNASDTVEFNATDSADSDGDIQSYEWDFGDGTTATGETVSHSYSSAGAYAVTLTVTDDSGATDTTTQTVSVGDGSGCPTDPVVCTYDPNGDIGTGELQTSINDFVNDEIETSDLQAVINAFIQSQ